MSGPVEIVGRDATTGEERPIRRVGMGLAVSVIDTAVSAGGRAGDSVTGEDHRTVAEEWAISDAVDLSVDAGATIWNGPCLLGGFWVETAIGTAAVAVVDGTTTRMTLPVSFAVNEHMIRPTIFETNLKLTPGATSTGSIRVWYRPLPANVTWAY